MRRRGSRCAIVLLVQIFDQRIANLQRIALTTHEGSHLGQALTMRCWSLGRPLEERVRLISGFDCRGHARTKCNRQSVLSSRSPRSPLPTRRRACHCPKLPRAVSQRRTLPLSMCRRASRRRSSPIANGLTPSLNNWDMATFDPSGRYVFVTELGMPASDAVRM